MLVTVKSFWRSKESGAGNSPGNSQPPATDRLKKLARNLDALTRHDELAIRRAREIGVLRRQAAIELHGICAGFVQSLNEMLSEIQLEFHPAEFRAENFQEGGVNLFQINARGRILQINFESAPGLVSTEDFRVPYILSGAVRCFNQQFLEKDMISEQLLFYTVEKSRHLWRFFDARTYRSGVLDADYLAGLMEQLL